MNSGRCIAYLITALFLLTAAGCASHPQSRADYKAIGEQVCKGHGGLALVDPVGESAVYTCRDKMTFKLATKPLL